MWLDLLFLLLYFLLLVHEFDKHIQNFIQPLTLFRTLAPLQPLLCLFWVKQFRRLRIHQSYLKVSCSVDVLDRIKLEEPFSKAFHQSVSQAIEIGLVSSSSAVSDLQMHLLRIQVREFQSCVIYSRGSQDLYLLCMRLLCLQGWTELRRAQGRNGAYIDAYQDEA